jgi:hypothetical protein
MKKLSKNLLSTLSVLALISFPQFTFSGGKTVLDEAAIIEETDVMEETEEEQPVCIEDNDKENGDNDEEGVPCIILLGDAGGDSAPKSAIGEVTGGAYAAAAAFAIAWAIWSDSDRSSPAPVLNPSPTPGPTPDPDPTPDEIEEYIKETIVTIPGSDEIPAVFATRTTGATATRTTGATATRTTGATTTASVGVIDVVETFDVVEEYAVVEEYETGDTETYVASATVPAVASSTSITTTVATRIKQ